MRGRTICAVGVLCLLVASERDVATQRAWQGTASELQEAALFARPAIMAEPGFTATLVVAPGDELEDPLGLVPHDDGTVWIRRRWRRGAGRPGRLRLVDRWTRPGDTACRAKSHDAVDRLRCRAGWVWPMGRSDSHAVYADGCTYWRAAKPHHRAHRPTLS